MTVYAFAPKVFIPVGHALFSLFLNRSGYPQEEGTLLCDTHTMSPEIIKLGTSSCPIVNQNVFH